MRKYGTKKLSMILVVLSLTTAFFGCAKEKTDHHAVPNAPSINVELNTDAGPMDLGRGLRITSIGKYAGIYLEDGSGDPVTGLLMVMLSNDNAQDLQIARFTMSFGDKTAEFEVTNLPAGESVVVLEKNRMAYTDARCDRTTLNNVAFFSDKMSLHEDQIEITGGQGSLSIKNLTDEPLGEIFVYYKNTAPDVLYGGITYRTKIDAGLEPGAMASVMSAHYNPSNTKILNVQIIPIATE